MDETQARRRRRFTVFASLLMAFPFLTFIPLISLVGWAFYAMPVLALSRILRLGDGVFVTSSGFGALPNFNGFLVTIPFWLVLGWFSGMLLFRVRQSKYHRTNDERLLRFGGGAVLTVFGLQIVIGFVLYWFTFLLTS